MARLRFRTGKIPAGVILTVTARGGIIDAKTFRDHPAAELYVQENYSFERRPIIIGRTLDGSPLEYETWVDWCPSDALKVWKILGTT